MTQANGHPEPEIIPPGASSDHNQSGGGDGKGGDGFEDMTKMFEHPMTWPRVTYGLYAVALVTGIPMLVGLIVAYIARAEAEPWLQTHYNFLIRTFWVGLALIIIGALTFIFGVGMFLLWIMPLWYVIRVVRGWMWLENKQPVPRPESWLFG